MKIVEKAAAVYNYECEKCLTLFTTEEEAIACENSHVDATGFTSKKFEHNNKYPVSVNVRMGDGTIQTYTFNASIPNDIFQNVTSAGKTVLAMVDGYSVIVQKEYEKEYEKDGETVKEIVKEIVAEKLSGVTVKLEDRKLFVDIPDDIAVLSTDTICVKVFDENDNEITAESENTIFDEVVISAEVRTVVGNDCIKSEDAE